MRSPFLASLAFFAVLLSAPASLAAELTATEMRWLQGAWPVVDFARQTGLPLDIVVQPQPTPGAAPLAMAFVGGRCKLVLSMRGNSEAPATLERLEPDLLAATLELMAAHELGHCRRYLDGAWYRLPSGFAADLPERAGLEPRTANEVITAARREEGYGDLVGLAWARHHHPQLYARLWAWLVEERSKERVAGADHDTLAWVLLAAPGTVLPSVSIFERAALWWLAGLGDAGGGVSVPAQQQVDRPFDGDLRGQLSGR